MTPTARILRALPILAASVMPLTANAQGVPEPGCHMVNSQPYSGLFATDELMLMIQTQAGARTLRMLSEDGMATTDAAHDRVNVVVDAKRRVVSVRCG